MKNLHKDWRFYFLFIILILLLIYKYNMKEILDETKKNKRH